MIRFLQLVLLLMFLSNAWSDDGAISGKIISLTGKRELVFEGDIFEAKILIWPFINQFEYHKEALKSFNLESCIKLLKINKMDFSKNNSDLLEIFGLFVLIKKPLTSSLIWKNKDLAIDFKMDTFAFNQTQGRLNEHIVLSQRKDGKVHVNYIITGLVISLSLLGIGYVILRRKKQKKVLNLNDEKKFYMDNFDHLDTREKIEQIYQEKRKWEKYIYNLDVYNEYLNCINQIQYKKNWTSHDLDVAVNTTKKLKESFVESSRVV